ncbi:MAG: hypothetical protein EPO21_11990 [Chloroflexota bacterium]|nr:MAG: hypothetical protein EPO21_11990 [Chloroflexota bacterium]
MNKVSQMADGYRAVLARGVVAQKLVLAALLVAALAVAGVAEGAGGYVLLTTWGSSGSGQGQINRPYGIAVDVAGNVYIADTSNNRVQKFSSTGAFLAAWGSPGSGEGQLNRPYGIAVDAAGNVYVADSGNNRIQKFSSAGTFLSTWGSYGSGVGQLSWPAEVALDAAGNVYVAEMYNHRVQKFTNTGAFLTAWGSYGTGDGQFEYPYGIAVDAAGDVYVGDIYNYRVQKFSSAGTFLAKWGAYGSGDGQFSNPSGVAVDAAGNVYVADIYDNRIQKFSSAGTFLLTWGSPGSGDGQFSRPYGIAVDSAGKIFVADTLNNRVQVFASDATPPVITPTVSGTAGSNGWYTGNVTVTWTVADPESAIAYSSGCEAVTLSADTPGTTLTCTATNGAGLSSASAATVAIDKTPPIFENCPTAGPFGFGGDVQTVGPIAADDGSGSGVNAGASTLTASFDTNTPGLTTFTATFAVVDNVGNGPTSKACAYSVTVRRAMLEMLNGLEGLRPGVTDAPNRNKLDLVITDLSSALDPALWTDGNHLDPQHGDKVFREARDAVNKLGQMVTDSSGSLYGSPQLQEYINRLVAATQELAFVAASGVATSNPTTMIPTNDEQARGDSERATGKRDSAIERYRRVWQHAVKALLKP